MSAQKLCQSLLKSNEYDLQAKIFLENIETVEPKPLKLPKI